MTYGPRTIRSLWWIITLSPPFNALIALCFRSSRSPDEALGIVFIIVPIFLLICFFAFLVLVHTFATSEKSSRHRAAALRLFLSLIPMYILMVVNESWIGWHGRGSSIVGFILCIAANVAWVICSLKLLQRYSNRNELSLGGTPN